MHKSRYEQQPILQGSAASLSEMFHTDQFTLLDVHDRVGAIRNDRGSYSFTEVIN